MAMVISWEAYFTSDAAEFLLVGAGCCFEAGFGAGAVGGGGPFDRDQSRQT